ncbi:MAG: hypothetical protein ACE5G2_06385 [Candidatus Krumholzibacteriia bacterium]
MQRTAPWDPELDSDAGVRDGLVALLLVSLGAALVIPILTHTWPSLALPPESGRIDYRYNLRILKLMLLLEGTGLVLLGVVACWRGAWLRGIGGLRALERVPGIVLALLCVSHALAFLFSLPPQQILSDEPVHTSTHAAHYYRIFAAHHLLRDTGRASGYDPFFMAGYPAGLVVDPDTRGDVLFAHLFAFVGLPYATKAYIVLVHLLVPVVVYAASRLVRLSRSAGLFAAFLAVVYWQWGRPFLGHLRWTGMHSYLLACQLGVLGIALFVRFFDPNHRVRVACYGAFFVIGALIGFVQPAGLLILPVGVGLAYLFGIHDLRRRDHAALLLALVVLSLLHASWFAPMFRQRHLLPQPAPGLRLEEVGDLFEVLWRPTSALVTGTLLLAILGAWRLRWRAPIAVLALSSTALAALAVAAVGAQIPDLRRLETARALVPAMLAACILAGTTLRDAFARVQMRVGAPLATLALVVALTLPPFLSILDSRFYYVHRLDATLDGRFHEMMRTLQDTSPVDARLLFETSEPGWLSSQAGDAALQALVPIYTKRETIGGPHGAGPLEHAQVDFGNGQLLGRPFGAWTSAELAAILERYNVGAALAWSPEARGFLTRHPQLLEPAATTPVYAAFRVRRASRALSVGEARVRAGYDRLELSDVRGDVLVLKYHWVEGLRSTPPVPIECAEVPGDPVGFIRVWPSGETGLVLHSGR